VSFVRGPSGVPHRGPAEVWADCIDVGCPNCGSLAGSYCVLRVGKDKELPKHAPCLQRIRAAERAAS
jgi:hypothetical protein